MDLEGQRGRMCVREKKEKNARLVQVLFGCSDGYWWM